MSQIIIRSANDFIRREQGSADRTNGVAPLGGGEGGGDFIHHLLLAEAVGSVLLSVGPLIKYCLYFYLIHFTDKYSLYSLHFVLMTFDARFHVKRLIDWVNRKDRGLLVKSITKLFCFSVTNMQSK